MKKRYLFGFVPTFLLTTLPAHAMCPVCTIAAGAGIGLSRWLGVDDTITGLWIGGFIMSGTLWLLNVLDNKNIKFFGITPIAIIAGYSSIVIPLYYAGIFGGMVNQIWGLDKLALGIALGSVEFFVLTKLYLYLKANNGGHAHFPFEKLAMTLGGLAVNSFVFYYITTFIYA